MATPTENFVPVTYFGASSLGSIGYLSGGMKWGAAVGTGVTLTYSFPGSYAYFVNPYPEFGDYGTLQEAEKPGIRTALGRWSDVANVKFTETADNQNTVGEIRIALTYTSPASELAHAYYPGETPEAGDIWLNGDYWNPSAGALTPGTYDQFTVLHEIGHSLGLKHPFEGLNAGPRQYDNYFYTVMSYTASPWNAAGDNSASFYPTTPMYSDLVAMQAIYGRNLSHNAGNTQYDFSQGIRYFQTIDDAGGYDTINYAGNTASCIINLNPGSFSSLGALIYFGPHNEHSSRATVAIGPNTLIERAIGGNGSDSINGNALANTLIGNSGNDTLNGGSGDDALDGGVGNDSLDGAAGADQINGRDGLDTASYTSAVSGAVTVRLGVVGTPQSTGGAGNDTLYSIENLTGSKFSDSLSGNPFANVLSGWLGNDTLNGGGGADYMSGGDGSDTYFVDNPGDVVRETNALAGSGGTDLVLSLTGTHVLAANVENARILLSGAANLTGNALNNTLFSGAGNNVLNGLAGSDTVSYAYAESSVKVALGSAGTPQATGGSGVDKLNGIENLTGSGFSDMLSGTPFANVLSGWLGNDTLNGGGGADYMSGGDGSDTYYVDNVGDVVRESNAFASGGVDLVLSLQASHSLAQNVENGRVIVAGPASLTGNGLDNVLHSGAGNTVLNGGGGLDTASYAYASSGVTVSLGRSGGVQGTGNSGYDTLISIENLLGSAYADILTGDASANRLTGGAGNDTLNGAAGNDTLIGGGGADVFIFNQPAGTGEVDRVVDFDAAFDLFHIGQEVVGGAFGQGPLGADQFVIGSASSLASACLIYDPASGALMFDDNGTDGIAARQFAALSTVTGTLDHTDFLIV